MKAIVLAGGEGTRLRPLTSTRPKPLMPVADRPCIDYILRSLVEAGIKKIIIATHYLSDKLIKAIGDGLEYDASIVYSFEETPAGTAGAVKKVEDFIDNTFVVAMGDIVADVDMTSLIEFHKDSKAAVTIALTKVDDPSQYGVAAVNEKGKIQRFLEKPKKDEAFSNLVNAGIYVLERRVIDFIPERRKFDFSKDLFPMLLSKRIPVYGKVLSGIWMDIGRPGDLLRASLEMVARRGKEGGIPKAETSGKLLVHDHVAAEDGVKIEGPCYFGGDVKIGAGAVVRRSCLHDGVSVGRNASIDGSFIMDNSMAGKRSEISGSVIGSGCEVMEGAKLVNCVIADGVKVKSQTVLRDATLS